MCTTHERISEVCEYFRDNREKYPGFKFYPCLPYAHKYANAAAGTRRARRRAQLSAAGKCARGNWLKGGVSLARKDVEGLAGLLIDAEMKMFAGLDAPIIFLQNVATDFLLGLGFDEAFRMFADHVRDRYRAEPGFITMNAPFLLSRLEKIGIHNPIICANINKIGFRMCGGMTAYENLFAQGGAV